MQSADDQSSSTIELALQGLQEERSTCVRQLEALLHAGAVDEAESFMQRIDNINATMIRVAGAHVVH